MADGKVKIDVDLDEKEAKQGLDNLGEAADDAAKEIDDLGDKAKKTGDAVGDLGDKSDKSSKGFDLLDIAAGNLVAGGISALISGIGEAISSLVSMAEETREFRDDMAKLNTAFETAGHSSEAASKVYEDFYAILGESDRSVEAVNHLAELTDNTEDLSKWSKIAAGVTAKFGDSLPIEGLTEAANETAKVGQTTGVLADALNWASKDSAVFKTALGGNQKALSAFNKALKDGENVEDAFTAALGKMSTEQERSAAITNTLSGLYDEAAMEYNEMTASTQAARRATAEMEAAQARLGAVMEPLATGVTNAKTALMNWVAEGLEAKEVNDAFTESQREVVTSSAEVAKAYRERKEATHEAALAQMSDVDYATNFLLPQLQSLVDANGKVKQGYEERAEFILGRMNEAWGTEYTRVSEIIGKNGELKQSVEEVINAKKAEILLSAHEEDYRAAVENSAAAENAWIDAAMAKAKAMEDVEAAEAHLTKVMEEEKDERGMLAGMDTASAQVALAEKKRILEEQNKAYDEALGNFEMYSADKAAYEHASTLIMGGNINEAISYLENLNAGYEKNTGTVQKSAEEQMAILEEQAIETGVKAVLMREAYEKGTAGVTEAMVKTAEKAAETAKTEFEKIGGNIGDSIGKGAEDKKPGLLTKIKNIVAAMKRAAEEEADINSPSKEFAWVGEMMMEGLSGGVEHGGKKAVESVRKVGADMVKEGQKTAKKNVKALEDELDRLDEIRTDKNRESIDKQRKQVQKELEIAREREKTMSSFATKYEKHLSDLKKLEEDYSKEHQAIFDKLATDSEKAIESYQSTFESRVQSIKSSLGLFDIVEKKESASGSEMSKALRSQVTELEKYNEALTTLFNRSGVTAAFYEEFSALGVGYLPQLEAINKMSDEQLSEYVALWEEKTALASQAAEKELAGERGRLNSELAQLKTDALKEAELLKTEYNGAMLELLGEITGGMLNAGNAGIEALGETVSGYVEAGAALMEGVAEGMESKQSEIIQQAVSAVRAAISAAKAEADINSPSRVTKDEIGANLALGVAEGWEDKLSKLRGSMSAGLSGITDRLRETVNAENARYGFSHGAPDTGFTELARAVNVQTAGINSLASAQRGGSSRPVVLMLDKRELGSAVVDVGSAETVRVGTKLITGGAR